MSDLEGKVSSNTIQFSIEKENEMMIREIFNIVDDALMEKGYDSISQIVGYIISGDPTYITSHNNARALIRKFDRDELLEELVRFYLEHNNRDE